MLLKNSLITVFHAAGKFLAIMIYNAEIVIIGIFAGWLCFTFAIALIPDSLTNDQPIIAMLLLIAAALGPITYFMATSGVWW